ncbi:MAG: M48 family metallopeptidase [Candidatus Omnitrophota bacterium]
MRDLNKKIILLSVLIAVFFLSGCATVYNPATGKKEYVMIGTEEEISIGNQVAKEVESKYKLSDDDAQNRRVQRIGGKIAVVSDRKDLRYYFKVIQDNEVNALSTPGGYVYVNTGLLDKADDDELAAVIAHEVGHIAARHAVQSIQANMTASLVSGLVFSKVKTSDEIKQSAAIALNLAMLGYSRDDEFEADKLGVKYSYYAGFRSDGMVTFLEKLQLENKQNPFDKALVYLRSHPLYSDRIARARSYAAYLEYSAINPSSQDPASVGRK